MLFRSLWTGSFSEFFNFPISNLQRLPWLGFKVQNGKGKESWGCHHSSHGSFFSCLCTKYVLAQCMAVGKASRRHWCSQLLVFQMCRQMAAGSCGVEALKSRHLGHDVLSLFVSLFAPIFTCLSPFEDRDHMLFLFVSFPEPGTQSTPSDIFEWINEWKEEVFPGNSCHFCTAALSYSGCYGDKMSSRHFSKEEIDLGHHVIIAIVETRAK